MTSQEIAIFAGGCFWCTEAVYQNLRGVLAVESGYIGGANPKPSYEQVCTGRTGHAEAIRIEFDPTVIPFAILLDVFFHTHDPTTLNRQGNDVGTQYRSAIFCQSESQRSAATEVIERLTREQVFPRPIVTEVVGNSEFFPAEKYHQNYFADNPYQPYCMTVVRPKVDKVRSGYREWLK